MAIHPKIEFAELDELKLDPLNPRLGSGRTAPNTPQEKILKYMDEFALEELGTSFVESKVFWPQEALIVVKEKLYGKIQKVVIEGNRRLAALILLERAIDGSAVNKKWKEIASLMKGGAGDLFTEVPYILADKREDATSFLGFRHVTGIKEWPPREKAEYIAKMVESGLSYEEVRRRIGSRLPAVRQHYVAFRLLRQVLDIAETIDMEEVERRFSVMYLTLRTAGVQGYLKIDLTAEPKEAKFPCPKVRTKQLGRYAVWIFGEEGSEGRPPLFTDSRLVDDFGRVLESPEAVEYLERTSRPSFEAALRIAGGDEPEIVRLIETAANNVELSLSRIHFYRDSKKVQAAVARLAKDAQQLLVGFPKIRKAIQEEQS